MAGFESTSPATSPYSFLVFQNILKMKKIRIVTEDGFQLSATLFESDTQTKELVIIGPATGAPQSYYRPFAKYVKDEKGMNSLIFDYRGVGESLDTSIEKSDASMNDWGTKDLKAIINWAYDHGYRIYLIGHSITGQLLPLTESADKIGAAYFVASQTTSSYFWEGKYRLLVLMFWRVIVPLLTKIYGYFPGWGMGSKISLPKGVVEDWRKWGLHKDGVIQGEPRRQDLYSRVTNYIHFLSMADDHLFAPRLATEQLMRRYFGARSTFEMIYPEDLSVKEIGHFGFFRNRFRESLWQKPIDYFKMIG